MPATLPCNIKKGTLVKEILIYTARGQLEGSWIAGILPFVNRSAFLSLCLTVSKYSKQVSFSCLLPCPAISGKEQTMVIESMHEARTKMYD